MYENYMLNVLPCNVVFTTGLDSWFCKFNQFTTDKL